MCTVKICVRHQPNIFTETEVESPPNTLGQKNTILNFDFDLAPAIQVRRVSDILLGLFGINILGIGLAYGFTRLKHMLPSLHVSNTKSINEIKRALHYRLAVPSPFCGTELTANENTLWTLFACVAKCCSLIRKKC